VSLSEDVGWGVWTTFLFRTFCVSITKVPAPFPRQALYRWCCVLSHDLESSLSLLFAEVESDGPFSVQNVASGSYCAGGPLYYSFGWECRRTFF